MCEYKKIDSPAMALDYGIRDYELKDKDKSVESGYIIEKEKKTYWNYLSNDAWGEFIKNMKPIHQLQFEDADGGEMKEKKGRWGIYPPKMASFGSSSRFLYNVSKDIEGFQFEKLLPTRVGHSANLDGYLMRSDVDVFVEAKCKEIYSSHKIVEISNVYKEIYQELKKKYTKFSYEAKSSKDKDHFNCTFILDEKPIVHFDIKQLICHFLGISANILENQKANTNIRFVYILFNPNHNTSFNNEQTLSYKEKIKSIYNETIKEIENFGDMKDLFDAVMEIQKERLSLPKKKYTFKFYIANQINYIDLIKK